MTRLELITSDEYIEVNVGEFVQSGKSVKKTRYELIQFIKGLRDELMQEVITQVENVACCPMEYEGDHYSFITDRVEELKKSNQCGGK